MAGSGCSGGTDVSEAGYLHLARRFERLMDLDTLESVEVCGVKLALS